MREEESYKMMSSLCRAVFVDLRVCACYSAFIVDWTDMFVFVCVCTYLYMYIYLVHK